MKDSTGSRPTDVIAPLSLEAKRTYKRSVFEALYELIQHLELLPGERLVETDLAARFGVSKTPIREALLLLEREGLVASVPHVGATVTWLTLQDYEQQLFIQDALEQPALPLVAAQITASELDSCAQLVKEVRRMRLSGDAHTYQHLVVRLHTELFLAARYPQLTKLIATVQQALRRYNMVFVRPFKENWDRELAIVIERFERVRRGDVAGAVAAVQDGHAAMLEFARERVRAADEAVLPYLAPELQVSRSLTTQTRRMGDRDRHLVS